MEKGLYLDLGLCVGCGACAVACMDQNDIYPEQGTPPLRRIYQVEKGAYPAAHIAYISASCNHCEDSPCLVGCPTGAIYRDEVTDSVCVDRDRCIGCHSCALACPFGVPRYDGDDKMWKCTLCPERVEEGLLPACAKTCPTGALQFWPINDLQAASEERYILSILPGEAKQ